MSLEIATNRKGLRDYHILDRLEAGVALKGTEIKSIREGFINVMGAFARIEDGELFLYGVDIKPYERASHEQHEPKRSRKLLLHRKEIDRLFGEVTVQGRALVALRFYWKNGRVKVELGIGKGKVAADKREDLKKKAMDRDLERELSRRIRR